MDSIEIWVDRGTGFVFLAVDTVPGYTDTAPLPAAGQSALWKYKAIYHQGDDRVGNGAMSSVSRWRGKQSEMNSIVNKMIEANLGLTP